MIYSVDSESLTSIANAIRAKTGIEGQIEFPSEFVSEIGGITNSVADSLLVAYLTGFYKRSSGITPYNVNRFCTVSDGVGTFDASTSFLEMNILFMPLVDLYSYLSSAEQDKVELTAGEEYRYYFTKQSTVYRTYLVYKGQTILDSGNVSSVDKIKVTILR